MPTIEMNKNQEKVKKLHPNLPTPNLSSNIDPNPTHKNHRARNATPSLHAPSGPSILQLNVEGLTKAKCEVIQHICEERSISVILLQETHAKSDSNISIQGFSLADAIHHPQHGIATLVRNDMTAASIAKSDMSSQTQWTATRVNSSLTVVNVYAPPRTDIQLPPILPHPVIYSGDFNSHHTNWSYQRNDANGIKISDWASNGDLHLLFDSKQPKTFHSAAWNTYTNPDLSFYSCDRSSLLPHPTHTVGPNFPRSQHRPTFITHPAVIASTPSISKPRWNFRKANWEKFTQLMTTATLPDPCQPNIDNTFQEFQHVLSCAARASIPRGYRKTYIPCWDKICSQLAKKHEDAVSPGEKQETANELLNYINLRRQERWLTSITNIDMKHSSRQAWKTINRLTGRGPQSTSTAPVTPNQIAHCLLKSGTFSNPDKDFTRAVNRDLKLSWHAPSADLNLCHDVTEEEVRMAIRCTKPGKSPGPDNLHAEFFHHIPDSCITWLTSFFTTCLKAQKIPKIWRTATVVAILKPNKPPDSPSSYRPISLLCIAFKLMERIIHNRIQPIVDSALPHEQAGFRPKRCTVDQVALLAENIEDSFEANAVAGAVFVDLSAAYDTVWHRGLTLKLLTVIPSKDMVRMIMAMISQRSFVVDFRGRQSRRRVLRNGVPQGSVLSPMLFNVYTHDLPLTVSQKYIYADDIALLHQEKSFSTVEKTLSKDLDQLATYFHQWRLQLNSAKTVCSVFHLKNRFAAKELRVNLRGNAIASSRFPKYLGVTLDRSLTYNTHLKATAAKVNARNSLLRRLAGNSWGADFAVLRTSALALCFSCAEYCSPVWAHSVHVKKIDVALRESMRLISGCIRSTPTDILPVLSGIVPPDIRREKLALRLHQRAAATDHLLHNALVARNNTQRRLRSRDPLSNRFHGPPLEISADVWAADAWRRRWVDLTLGLRRFIEEPSPRPAGCDLPRAEWVLLNRLRSGHGRFAAFMHKIGLAPTDACRCGHPQTSQHVLQCPAIGLRGSVAIVDSDFRNWLRQTDLSL